MMIKRLDRATRRGTSTSHDLSNRYLWTSSDLSALLRLLIDRKIHENG
jgi:hypothetical protein